MQVVLFCAVTKRARHHMVLFKSEPPVGHRILFLKIRFNFGERKECVIEVERKLSLHAQKGVCVCGRLAHVWCVVW